MIMYRVFILPLWVLWILFSKRSTRVCMPGFTPGGSSAKLLVLEARYNNLINSGGSVGGDFYVNGNHTVTGDMTTSTCHINGTQKKMRQGPKTSPPGGAPNTYLPTYESDLSQMGADANTTGHNAGDWS
jgi:hypothetical protein